MKLRTWMTEQGRDDAWFAAQIEARMADGTTCSPKTVEKWRYGTRTPRRKMMPVIAAITNHAVLPNDFVDIPAQAA